MLIRDLKDCQEIIAGDNTILRELLHPTKDDVNLRYSLAHAKVKPGKNSQPHKLKVSEIYYIIEGEGVMHINDETQKIHSDQVIYIPANAKQYIQNSGDTDLIFLCIVDPAWQPEDEQVL